MTVKLRRWRLMVLLVLISIPPVRIFRTYVRYVSIIESEHLFVNMFLQKNRTKVCFLQKAVLLYSHL